MPDHTFSGGAFRKKPFFASFFWPSKKRIDDTSQLAKAESTTPLSARVQQAACATLSLRCPAVSDLPNLGVVSGYVLADFNL